jgi:uncharacterized protein (TIGR03067 family)
MKAAIPTIALTLFALTCTALFAAEPAVKVKVGRDQPLTTAMLAGTYTIESAQKGDDKTPADKLEGTVVTFTGNTIVAVDRDKNEMYAATFKLDSSKTPATIHMISTMPEAKGAKANGLVQREGNIVKLIYAMPDEGEMPSKFEPGKGQRMMTLKRIQETASVPLEKK